MPTKVFSGAVSGIDGLMVEVETDITPGLPTTVVVGLPDTAVQEARERVKSAIKNTGFSFPRGRVAVNLAPADLPKSGSLYDLPIAVSILAEEGLININTEILTNSLFLGELALDGRVRGVNGTLPITMATSKLGLKNIFIPKENYQEAALVKNLNIFPVESLEQLIAHLEQRVLITPAKNQVITDNTEDNFADLVSLGDIAGQQAAKRALIIAAAGHHNILFTGPPGSGKTMLAKALRSILPPLSEQELLDVTKIYSIAGLLNKPNGLAARPFRSPHHTSSRIALIGGGTVPRPGEVTLAHKGVLFLDEFPEFPRSSLEALRQPLEDGLVTVSRASGSSIFPAEFILVAAQNPCPCGNYGNPNISCQCSDTLIRRYRTRISGPILDRIDLVVEVPNQPYEKLRTHQAENTEIIKNKIIQAKKRQQERFGSDKVNARLSPSEIKKYCQLDDAGEKLLETAVNKMHLSARSYHRILKVSRTIADLEAEDYIKAEHVSEALQYRPRQE